MAIIALFLFLFSVSTVAYSYVIFPFILLVKSKGRQMNKQVWSNHPDEWPRVSVVMSAYNEEKVLSQKLDSIFNSGYPHDKLEVLVGSDASSDSTNETLKVYQQKYPRILLPFLFTERRGKPAVINDLVGKSTAGVIVLTDANVFFEKDTLFKLIRHFRNPSIGLVGSNILNVGMRNDGISFQEKAYIERENLIKYQEGVVWGTMMGPFGGCYALRRELYETVPENFLVDDFFICMNVLKKGYKAINELESICYEDVSNDVRQEYRRKSRISAGNFQNLREFGSLLRRPFSPLGFCFLSHKVLRWLTPFLILLSLVSLVLLVSVHPVFYWMLIAELLLLLAPIFDFALGKLGLHNRLLRFVAYFAYMNLALLKGYFRYLGGVRSGTWTPTSRTM